ncbi:hypothetical protein [Dickeya sp. NCPPB 3274]|uniref:hypothetical protein n=1 Tax=Dickeya sp. NCPPB 3274 TaxID=568766 RepID=UPI001267C3AD|nr:hypothetical protein [Dickeya sp. NCPPB 3274]
MNNKKIMLRAWGLAAMRAKFLGGKKSQYFSYCLKVSWHKEKNRLLGTDSQRNYANGLYKSTLKEIFSLREKASISRAENWLKYTPELTSLLDRYTGSAAKLILLLKDINFFSTRSVLFTINSLRGES